MINSGLEKLKKANVEIKALREKSGFKVVKIADRKVYILERKKAVSIASSRLFNKNLPSSLDGIESLKKINKLATELQEQKGQKIIKGGQKKVYKISQSEATKIYWSNKKKA